MRRGALLNLGSQPSYRVGIDTYNQDQLGLGPLMIQQNSGANSFAGPFPVAVNRPMEASTAIPLSFPSALQWSNTATSQWDWVFTAEISSAATTRRFGMHRFNRLTGISTYDGFITVTFPGTVEARTIRGLRVDYRNEITGTTAVSGVSVTGTSTLFQTNRVCVGNRIGFGSTDPDLITQWYEISAIASNTGITLTTTAGTIPSGTPYVIEDLRLAVILTSLTTSLGGLYLVKGLRREVFSSTGSAIPAATTVDNIRACYFLRDAAVGTALVSFGGSIENYVSPTERYMWVLETLANPRLYKFNIRAALTVAAGATTSAFEFRTGNGGAMAGTVSQFNNGRLANAAHGPGQGLNCIYWASTTRIYRSADVSTITDGSTSWMIDNMVEIPPGSATTFAATSVIQAIEYSDFIDRFVVTTTGVAGARSYITQYRTDGGQMDRIILAEFRQLDQSTADSSTTPFPSINGTSFSVWIEGGVGYFARNGTTSALNQLYVIPVAADWEYAASTGCRLIFPRIECRDIDAFVMAFGQEIRVIGGATGANLGMSPQPYRLSYRASGISDNSGTWIPLSWSGDLSGISGAQFIQLMAEFRMDNTMIPARIQSVGVLWDDLSTLENYNLSVTQSDAVNKRIAWWFGSAFGANVPPLRVRLYDAVSGGILVDDNTTAPTGTFQRSVDNGVNWTAWNNTDRANVDTYLRYTPASLADNIKVRAVLTRA